MPIASTQRVVVLKIWRIGKLIVRNTIVPAAHEKRKNYCRPSPEGIEIFGNIEPLGTSKLLGIKTGNRTEKFFGRLTTYDACLLIQLHERDFMSWKRFADYHKTAKYLADYRFDHLQRREIPYPELILLLVFQYGYILWLNWQSPKTGDSNLYCASQLYTADASMRYVCKIVNSAITVWYIM